MNPKVDFYFRKAEKWHEELAQLRIIMLDSGLTEEVKWGVPCYTLGDKNIVLIHDFKEYCAVLFFKGALLSDPRGVLIQQTDNVQAARQMRFTSVSQLADLTPTLNAYILEAINAEKAGLKVSLKKTTEFAVPDEFRQRLDAEPALDAAFKALTPGRQRGYLLHFSAPKQAKTRESRIEKCIPQIMDGKGLND